MVKKKTVVQEEGIQMVKTAGYPFIITGCLSLVFGIGSIFLSLSGANSPLLGFSIFLFLLLAIGTILFGFITLLTCIMATLAEIKEMLEMLL